MSDRVKLIEEKIITALNPSNLEINDNSAAHAGHPGAMERGGGHFKVAVTSDKFKGLSIIEQHKLVYAAVKDLISDGTIHALGIETRY